MQSVSRGKVAHYGLASELTVERWQDLMPVCVHYARMEAVRRCELSLVRVLEYSALHRSFPKSLSEAGAAATDPFDGRQLRYKVAGGVCKVYSVGPDLRDDGGQDRRDLPEGGKDDEGWDVVARYPAHVSKK